MNLNTRLHTACGDRLTTQLPLGGDGVGVSITAFAYVFGGQLHLKGHLVRNTGVVTPLKGGCSGHLLFPTVG